MSPKKFLLIRFSSIGDVALTAPTVAALAQHFPDCVIHLLTKKGLQSLWRGDPRVIVRSYDPDGDHFGLPGFFRFIGELRRERYDYVVDLHSLPKTWLLALALGRPTLRYDKASLARRRYVATKQPPADMVHTARRYLRALAPLGIDTEQPMNPIIGVEETAANRVAALLKPVGVQGRELVVLAPGSQWATKQWGWEKFAEIVTRLHERGDWVAFVGGKAEQVRCEEIAMGKRVLNFAGMLDLQETLALMDFARLMITNDSGPMHMAGARGVPVIALYGSTTRGLGFWPLTPHASIIDVELACRPCHPHGQAACPEGHFRCMKEIAVDRVWSEVEKFLGPIKQALPEGTDEDEGVFHFGEE